MGSEEGTLLSVLVVVGLVKGGLALTLFALVLVVVVVVVRLLVLVLERGVRARVLAKENGMRSSRRPGTYQQAHTIGE